MIITNINSRVGSPTGEPVTVRVGSSFGGFLPRASADFTKGIYKVKGASKTFTDLFTFTRSGRAWLVKETGLQEYAADVPRFDNGLLIEQSATNYAYYSFLPSNGVYIKRNVQHNGHTWEKIDKGAIAFLYTRNAQSDSAGTASIFHKSPNNFEVIVLNNDQLVTTTTIGYSYAYFTRASENVNSGLLWKASEDTRPFAFQLESGSRTTSPIQTTTKPTTRPADFLLNKITGTTVTGDWDSTLNLSIVDGQLVHSGYGRIRSLEIN